MIKIVIHDDEDLYLLLEFLNAVRATCPNFENQFCHCPHEDE